MRFIVGDRVCVSTHRHGPTQHGREGVITEPQDDDGWFRVRFSEDEDDWNFYEPGDLSSLPTPTDTKPYADYYTAVTECSEEG